MDDEDVDVDTFAIESFERVEGADDKSEKTGGVKGNPTSSSSRSNGDGGDKDANCFDNSSGDIEFLLVLFILLIITGYMDTNDITGYYIIVKSILLI